VNVYEYKMFKYNCLNFLAEDTIIQRKRKKVRGVCFIEDQKEGIVVTIAIYVLDYRVWV